MQKGQGSDSDYLCGQRSKASPLRLRLNRIFIHHPALLITWHYLSENLKMKAAFIDEGHLGFLTSVIASD